MTALSAAASAPQSRFRSGTTSVSVNVSVRAGNTPATGLTASDFVLTDNGVQQAIDSVAVEAVPIDVTLILDTSGSTAGGIGRLVTDAREIAGLLRPIDRLRLLTIDTYVHQLLPMQPAKDHAWPSRISFNGASSVYDALVAGMIAPVDVDRRHLVVAMTDGKDTTSVLNAATVRDVAGRSDAVLHVVIVDLPSAPPPVPRNWLPRRDSDLDGLQEAARRSGGQLHRPGPLLSSTVRAFEAVFDDFRQSYVLRYTPARVRPDGWHEIQVKIERRGNYTVRARKGYFGDSAGAPRRVQ
jgi:VWFA-related protein